MAAWKEVMCPACDGNGKLPLVYGASTKCGLCHGSGEILERDEAWESMNKQEAKADAGKPRLSLVPTQIIYDIARVREYGNEKYGDSDNWKTVEAQRYVDAMFRHLLDFVADPDGRDEESGLPHLWHLECNAAFLSELMKGRWQ
jgi:RecJ-like exonuclease